MARQNLYDDEHFFARYQRMRDTQGGLNETLEQPSMLELLPDVRGAIAFDLGCGDGALSRELVRRGATKVTGVDPSARMLALAVQRTDDDRVTYARAFAEEFNAPDMSTDIVVSSLALHYLSLGSFVALINAIARWLRPQGTVIASMEHPIKTATPDAPAGHRQPVVDYDQEGSRCTTWFGHNVLKHHRTFATILNTFIDAGFGIERVLEPAPTSTLIKERPELAMHSHRPPLLLLRAKRTTNTR